MMNHCYVLEIAGIKISLSISKELVIEEKFQQFLSEGTSDTEVSFVAVDLLPQMAGLNLVTEEDARFSEFEVEKRYMRLFHQISGDARYAVLYQVEPKRWVCEYLRESEGAFASVEGCFRHLAFERILLENDAMILHSSLVKVSDEGILFTGVSGVGKSTQAALWEMYEQATVLNGDRTILKKVDGLWYGYGSPYAGSSNIYRNEGVPVRAIVALGQTTEEKCVRLRMQEAFRKVYAGLTINTWNPQFVERILDWSMELCMMIPVYFLECRPEKSAVELLKENLQ